MDFKDRLLYVGAKINLSQEQLAKYLKVSFATVNRWENGKMTSTEKAILQFKEF